jgi:hypothetical protein
MNETCDWCGPAVRAVYRVPAWPALPGLPYQRAFPAGTHARFVDQMIHKEKKKKKGVGK